MIRRRKPLLQRLVSGLYVPLLLHFADPYPCDTCCGDCPCSACDGSDPPCCLKIVVSGIIEGTCGECDCLNDTFYVPRLSDCAWQQNTDPYLCDSNPAKATAYLDGSDYKLKFELGGNVWIKNYGATKPTCQSLVNESIPYSASGSDCDASSSTCLVTAIAGVGEDVCPSIPFECGSCKCNLFPKEGFQVVITGVADDPGPFPPCPPGECADFNATYIVDRHSGACQLSYTFESPICGGETDLVVRIGTQRLEVGTEGGLGAVRVLFRKDFGSVVACRDLVDENIPWHALSNCGMSTATCLVTSL